MWFHSVVMLSIEFYCARLLRRQNHTRGEPDSFFESGSYWTSTSAAAHKPLTMTPRSPAFCACVELCNASRRLEQCSDFAAREDHGNRFGCQSSGLGGDVDAAANSPAKETTRASRGPPLRVAGTEDPSLRRSARGGSGDPFGCHSTRLVADGGRSGVARRESKTDDRWRPIFPHSSAASEHLLFDFTVRRHSRRDTQSDHCVCRSPSHSDVALRARDSRARHRDTAAPVARQRMTRRSRSTRAGLS